MAEEGAAPRKRAATRSDRRTDGPKAPSPNRGRGIYFSDVEFEELMDEVAAQIIETRRPVSISEVVRTFVREGIERNQAAREKGSESSKSHKK